MFVITADLRQCGRCRYKFVVKKKRKKKTFAFKLSGGRYCKIVIWNFKKSLAFITTKEVRLAGKDVKIKLLTNQ